ncbi:MAG: NAD-dependent epimerase/dehydratase family protein [Gammaproteobacteria bacterium]
MIRQKVLLTGATGFLGSHIAELLSQDGYQVRCLVRTSSDTSFLKTLDSIEILQGSFDSPTSLQQAVQNVDVIIHNAGVTRSIRSTDFYKTNVDNTTALLNSAQRYNPNLTKFIYISSLAAAGPSSEQIPHENHVDPAPISHYGQSKRLAEIKVLDFQDKLPVTVIRPPAIYGPRDKDMLIFFRALRYRLGLLIHGGKTKVSMIYAQDAAAAIVKAITNSGPSGNIYFINDGHVYSWRELISELAITLSKPSFLYVSIPIRVIKILGLLSECYERLIGKPAFLTKDKIKELSQSYWTCNSQKTQLELNWKPKETWATGSKLTFEWYRKMNWL